jgi:hypothetical protein
MRLGDGADALDGLEELLVDLDGFVALHGSLSATGARAGLSHVDKGNMGKFPPSTWKVSSVYMAHLW